MCFAVRRCNKVLIAPDAKFSSFSDVKAHWCRCHWAPEWAKTKGIVGRGKGQHEKALCLALLKPFPVTATSLFQILTHLAILLHPLPRSIYALVRDVQLLNPTITCCAQDKVRRVYLPWHTDRVEEVAAGRILEASHVFLLDGCRLLCENDA